MRRGGSGASRGGSSERRAAMQELVHRTEQRAQLTEQREEGCVGFHNSYNMQFVPAFWRSYFMYIRTVSLVFLL